MHRTASSSLSLSERLSHFLSRAKGVNIETDLDPYLALLDRIRRHELADRSGEELRELATDLRRRAVGGESLDDLLSVTYAMVAEAARRELRLEPFDEQILAAVVVHRGKLAQMQTGEGKTLAAVFAAALNALSGNGVHVMTANDYLARRDAEWMGPVYRFLGLRVAYVQERTDIQGRRDAYDADVTYLTAREAGFDLLRDQLRYRREDIVQRAYHLAILDEADSILIDEARIPLVIAGASPQPDVDPLRIEVFVSALQPGEDFGIDRTRRRIHLTTQGQDKVQDLLGGGGIDEEKHMTLLAAVNVALHAHHLLARDVDYIVRGARIELVDEFTGRIASGRRWPHGIQSALEAKEGLEPQPEGIIYGSITVQHFITLYPRLAGLTATAASAASELASSYGLGTVIIPPHRRSVRIDAPDCVFATQAAKVAAIVGEIQTVHAAGRPILAGTTSVKASQTLAELLGTLGIGCEVLNAKNDEKEAELVARAGMLGAVTVSTNMAGRGTDIKLGGEEGTGRERIKELGGLYVIGSTRHESVRIDNQLRGRAGRQGDPGLSRFYVSLEDELVERYAITELMPTECLGTEAGDAILDPRVAREIARAQGIIETQNHELRRLLRRYSEIVETERRHIQGLRQEALRERTLPESLRVQCSAHLGELESAWGHGKTEDILIRLYLLSLDRFWADHLLFVEEVKEGAPLQRLGGDDPLLHFIRRVDEAFRDGLRDVEGRAAERFDRIHSSRGEVDLAEEGMEGPSSTWTYLTSEDPLPGYRVSLSAAARIGAAAATATLAALPLLVATPFVALWALARRLVVRRQNGNTK
jgi:preprotein translocase subunit SecA